MAKRLDRLEALLSRNLENDAGARAALLGTQLRPSFALSKMYEEYEEVTKDEIKNFSRNQLRVWRGGRKRVVRELVDITGDKPVTALNRAAGLLGHASSATTTIYTEATGPEQQALKARFWQGSRC
jgi:hypothetical protein